jgi:hypothetical protein
VDFLSIESGDPLLVSIVSWENALGSVPWSFGCTNYACASRSDCSCQLRFKAFHLSGDASFWHDPNNELN